MPTKVRLKRMGSKKRPFYRLVAADSRSPRDGRFIETLGFYNPVANPAVIQIDEESVFKWFERGAVPTTSAASLLRRVGCLQKWELMKQGVSGEELKNRVEAIKIQRERAAARSESKKREVVSEKARAKAEADKAQGDEAQADEAEADEAQADEAQADEAQADKARGDKTEAAAAGHEGSEEGDSPGTDGASQESKES